jgi:hypothetical protein
MIDPKVFRTKQLSELTDAIGVYALCDLDGAPVYIGQSTDGIRTRVRRHLTSARSDVIANRMIDVWEIAYVWAWPAPDLQSIPNLEAYLFCHYDAQKTLMNGKLMPDPGHLPFSLPEKQIVQVINDETIKDRLDPQQRLPRQISQYLNLVDYILTVKDEDHLKRSLHAHFERLVVYHNKFLS